MYLLYSTLDLCLVDSENVVIDYWKTEVPFIDGHDLIAATIKYSIVPPILQDFTYRGFKSLDLPDFQNYLSLSATEHLTRMDRFWIINSNA